MLDTSKHACFTMAGQTDSGRVRDHNEDVVLVDNRIRLALIADGMGGYNAGEIAARMAVDVVAEGTAQAFDAQGGSKALDKADPATGLSQAGLVLRDQVLRANEAIFESSLNEPEYEGMGTTLVGVLLTDRRLVVAHVGDSRCYRLRNGSLMTLTRDHSLLQEQIDCGEWKEEDAGSFPHKNLVTRALGAERYGQVDLAEHFVEPDDLYLLCSDGLTDMLDTTQIMRLLLENNGDLTRKVALLIQTANEMGGRDNVSVVLIGIAADPTATPAVIRKRKVTGTWK
ncbi:MAG: Stp1/IreP family PP2C-type Ser/Thr phosphatase [Burkholderiales bacterium]|jgi:protein phosphatase|nr:Stp1/IreP family PP2C-type Ser/Thr phosphatase [Burkholderiales bacterium]